MVPSAALIPTLPENITFCEICSRSLWKNEHAKCPKNNYTPCTPETPTQNWRTTTEMTTTETPTTETPTTETPTTVTHTTDTPHGTTTG